MSRYCIVAFTDTLMAWNEEMGVFAQSGDHHSEFYFRLPQAWDGLSDADLEPKIFTVAKAMYADLNAGFRRAEPNDTSYMIVKSTEPLRLMDEVADAKLWLTARNPAVWESTPCVVVNDDGSYTKVARDAF